MTPLVLGVLGAAQPQPTSPAQGRSGCCFLADISPRFPSSPTRGCREEAALIIANYCSRADGTRMSSAAPSPPSAMLHLPTDPRQPLSTPALPVPAPWRCSTVPRGSPASQRPPLGGKGGQGTKTPPEAPGYGREGHHHPEPVGTVPSLHCCLLRDADFISLNGKGAAGTQSFPRTARFS